MSSNELIILITTAASVGLLHTLLGPDHYVPFIVIGQAKKWSLFKLGWVTFFCGVGHILSSVVLGIIGIALGIAVTKLKVVESVRGNIAGWALIAFGLVYFIWGIRRAIRNRPHEHWHFHKSEGGHTHLHTHNGEHLHTHKEPDTNITLWVLFTIFIFGPCEPLIPIVMYPAARGSTLGVILVTAIFGSITIATMLTIVITTSLGISFLPVKRLERYTHALAGFIIFLSGIAIQFLGL